ncbi:hypothetical protein Tco_0732961, partial [Tanacetum coccineum]
ANIDADTVATEAAAAREADVGVKVGIGSDKEEEADDDMLESADKKGLDRLMQELYDHLVK